MNKELNTTDVSLVVQILNDSGAPVTGLDAASFPDVYLIRDDGSSQLTPLIDLAAVDSTHADGGVKELAAGRYRLDLPDSPFTSPGPLDIAGESANKRLLHPQINVGSTGNGANKVTITINDGSSPLESVSVRVTKGSETYVGTTNGSGQVIFHLDAGGWDVAATLPGYTYAGTTLVVDGTETETYSMTASGLSVPTSPRIRARLLVLDSVTKEGKSGVDLTVVVVDEASADGYASEAVSRTVTSDDNGLAEWYALPGEHYDVTGPNGVKRTIKIPATATDPHPMSSIVV